MVKKASKKRRWEEKPSLYSTDLGLEGVKKKSTTPSSNSKTLGGALPLTHTELQKRKERQSRFGTATSSLTSETKTDDPSNNPLKASRGSLPQTFASHSSRNTGSTSLPLSINTDQQLIGENQNLEKPYLRLTTFPRKEDVRPLAILQKSLSHIKARYEETEDFAWSNEQLKSVRQDITVQGIRNDFVLRVYETHSRILLEHGDLNEFNQCQTMVRSLTEGTLVDDSLSVQDTSSTQSKKKKKKKKRCRPLKQTTEAADEFGAYAVLYAVVQRSWMSLKMELMRIRPLLHLDACRHAMAVVQAVSENDYRRFFALYDKAPHMSVYLMDFMLKRVRMAAYESIVAAFRPSVEVRQLQNWLGFLDSEETSIFLKERGAVYVHDTDNTAAALLDCKACCGKTSN